jgi:hypothetical protein
MSLHEPSVHSIVSEARRDGNSSFSAQTPIWKRMSKHLGRARQKWYLALFVTSAIVAVLACTFTGRGAVLRMRLPMTIATLGLIDVSGPPAARPATRRPLRWAASVIMSTTQGSVHVQDGTDDSDF